MNTQEPISDEIVVVGGRYGDYADVLMDLYEQNKPIEPEEMRKALGGDEVILAPDSNDFVPYAVGVFDQMNRRLGYVWMRQAPAIQAWLAMNGLRYLSARITEFDHVSKSLKAETSIPIQLPVVDRWKPIDFGWASDLPLEHAPLTEASVSLSVMRLYDELNMATEWNERLQRMIDNLLRALPTDLSEHRSQECYEVYMKMKHSKISEVRQRASEVLRVLIREESNNHLNWWMRVWLPAYFKETVTAGVDKMFAYSNYTLEKVEHILEGAPYNLFNIYKAMPQNFAFRLYFSSLPLSIYNRLLTLLAVREAMMDEQGQINGMLDKGLEGKMRVKLRFFKDRCFKDAGGQESLRGLIKSLLPRIDEESGRDWICLYMGYLFFKDKRIIMKKYVDFFSDIEALMPNILTKVDQAKSGYARYRQYIDTMTLEITRWFIEDGCLPPVNIWRSKTYDFQVDDKRQERIQGLTSEVLIELKMIQAHH